AQAVLRQDAKVEIGLGRALFAQGSPDLAGLGVMRHLEFGIAFVQADAGVGGDLRQFVRREDCQGRAAIHGGEQQQRLTGPLQRSISIPSKDTSMPWRTSSARSG